MNWKSIETAPKDGTAVLLCRSKDADGKPIDGDAWGVFVQVAAWWEDGEWVVYCSLPSEPRLHFNPDYWMELPNPPD